ncbi:hypothetical protein [Methanobrevibacter sp. DSM 116169]|uniref:hypothetical protein n=1 Tax=Methanobrevibacter sp. DSM 116169 TaxID=3242727 RepID=UPI0038FCC0EA
MKCRVCGFDFNEEEIKGKGCTGCGKKECSTVHCPNCGFGNDPVLDEEFQFIKDIKKKINKKFSSKD